MNTTHIRALCSRAVELGEKATKGPWLAVPDQHWSSNQRIESAECVTAEHARVATLHITAWKVGHRDARPDAAFIASAREGYPALARAMLELLPYLGHHNNCAINYTVCIGDEHGTEAASPPCDCGLSSALSGSGEGK